jgi:hypothetical protein
MAPKARRYRNATLTEIWEEMRGRCAENARNGRRRSHTKSAFLRHSRIILSLTSGGPISMSRRESGDKRETYQL